MLLLAKQQIQYLQTYFETPELDLRDRFKPVYYVFLYATNDPNFHKLPPELSELVHDIIKQVNQLAADYV